MIYKEHLIELYVNGNKVELEDQKSLNLRFNNVLFDPTNISSTQAEYSFEFEIPQTPKNNIIFDYANNLAKLNKFRNRYNAEVYADGTVIFSGTITLNGSKDGMYEVNLVSVKVYSLDDIFGDMKMNEIKWKIPFEGGGVEDYSIDYYNSQLGSEVTFPLVSYGVFPKDVYNTDSVGSDYTSKFDLDKWNKWYIESFYPSPNVMGTLKKCFESVGYNVGGDAFNNEFLKDIYASTNLADGQDPIYNIGNPKFGKVDLSVSWTTPQDIASSAFDSGSTFGTVQGLKYPYFRASDYVVNLAYGEPMLEDPTYNLENVRVYDILESGVTLNGLSYMYQPNEHIIVIPSDGFYKIGMEYSFQQPTTALTASQKVHDWNDSVGDMTNTVTEKDITFNSDIRTTTPFEIQLVRNYDDNIELIKGKNNMRFKDGYPDNTTEMGRGTVSNYENTVNCFPHEQSWSPVIPTKRNDLETSFNLSGLVGYAYKDNTIMAYDQVVSPTFICGFTTMGNKNGGGCNAVMKNGYSWSKLSSNKNYSFYTQNGYQKVTLNNINTGDYSYEDTEFNYNQYLNSPISVYNENQGSVNGKLSCMVYLNKNDVLRLLAVHRDYNTTSGASVSYGESGTVNVTIQAASPNSYVELIRKNYGYHSPIEFDVDLNIANFFNKETRVSDWVQQIIDAFNLEFIQDGKNAYFSTKKPIVPSAIVAVDIDDRTNYKEAVTKAIDYPKSMAIRYKIDTDEWGFERSAVESTGGDEAILDEEDWKKYGESGYTVIELNDDSYATTKSEKSLQFSYTWYDNFNWFAVNESGEQTSQDAIVLNIPVISKYSYMIDGYDYEESEKHDGYGLSQRFWFRPSVTGCYVYTNSYPKQRVTLFEPSNVYGRFQDINFNLSYKNTERSLLTEFFNINAYLSSNYVEIEAYLSPTEYNRIRNGSLVRFDSDLYIVVEVSAYDPSGHNKTTLKLMKKVV